MSPVVAAIILIAVTVAVSIAVAAWMGALTIGFFGGAEQLNILEVTFPTDITMKVEVSNTGGSDIVITEVRVDGISQNISSATVNGATWTPTDGTYTLEKGKTGFLTLDFGWSPGVPYNIHVKTTRSLFGPYPVTGPS